MNCQYQIQMWLPNWDSLFEWFCSATLAVAVPIHSACIHFDETLHCLLFSIAVAVSVAVDTSACKLLGYITCYSMAGNHSLHRTTHKGIVRASGGTKRLLTFLPYKCRSKARHNITSRHFLHRPTLLRILVP